MPPAGDDAAVVRPNPDSFYSSHAFTLSRPDEPDEMLIQYPTTGATGVCEPVASYHSLGDFEAAGRVGRR
jgi:hypothetical protein